MKRDLKLFLEDIISQIELIENSVKSRDKLSKDVDIKDATVRRLEIIGEATKNIPNSFRKKYPNIEWKAMAGTRDRISHAYFDVNLDTVWDIIKDDLPKLKKQIQEILEKENFDWVLWNLAKNSFFIKLIKSA